MGPIGRYTLEPGQYDVVVESISDRGVTPGPSNWDLVSGDQYSSCFFIVTTFWQNYKQKVKKADFLRKAIASIP